MAAFTIVAGLHLREGPFCSLVYGILSVTAMAATLIDFVAMI